MRVKDVAWHRNGISGEPFAVVLFTHEGNRIPEDLMVGIVFQSEGHVAVFNVARLAQGDIKFASNSYRGDRFERELREAVHRAYVKSIKESERRPENTSNNR